MSVRQTALLLGLLKNDVLAFVESNNLETIYIRLPNKIIIQAITLPTIGVCLENLLEQDGLKYNRLSLDNHQWKELIEALKCPSPEEVIVPNPCFFKGDYQIIRVNPIQIHFREDRPMEILVSESLECHISYTEGLRCIKMNNHWLMSNSPKKAKILSRMNLSNQANQCRYVTQRGIKREYSFHCKDWLLIWNHFARKGNQDAIAFLTACAQESVKDRVERLLRSQRA